MSEALSLLTRSASQDTVLCSFQEAAVSHAEGARRRQRSTVRPGDLVGADESPRKK